METNNSYHRNSSHPLPSDTAGIKTLWQTTFQDSDEFVDFFFKRVYSSENTLVVKKNGTIVSALQMIPYEIKVADDIIPSAYICGVCTLPSERGKGLMKSLMYEAFEYMRQKGYGITTLIPAHPWLFDFYKNFGYEHPIKYNIEYYSLEHDSSKQFSQTTTSEHTTVSCQSNINTILTPYSDKYFPYLNNKQCERQCAILHNAYDIENIICDLKSDNGNAWISLHEDTPVGIAFVNPISDNDIIIKDILYDNTRAKEALIYQALNTHNAKTAKVRVPLQETNTTKISGIADMRLSGCINKKTFTYGLACLLDKRINDIKDLYMTLMLD